MSKITVDELRGMIREEFMRGVPEFVVRKAADDCVLQVRAQVMKFIQMRAEDETHRRELTRLADDAFGDLSEDLYQVLEEKLYQFLQNV